MMYNMTDISPKSWICVIICGLLCSDAQVWAGNRSAALHPWPELVWASYSQGQVSISLLYYVVGYISSLLAAGSCAGVIGVVSCRYTFGKPVAGKLTVNMTVNGVGYYRHEMGHPVIKTMEVSCLLFAERLPFPVPSPYSFCCTWNKMFSNSPIFCSKHETKHVTK